MKTEVKLWGSYVLLFLLSFYLFQSLSNKINTAFRYESIEIVGLNIVIAMSLFFMLILNQLWYLVQMYHAEKDKGTREIIEKAKLFTPNNSKIAQ